MIDFYKRDVEIFERCDDSYGNVGDVFRITAAGMFADYARQIKDGVLFERTRQRNWQKLNCRAYVDIAKVYFSSGDAVTAYDRLQKVSECGGQNDYEYAELFREVCLALGKHEEVQRISWDIFHRHRCLETLNELIAQIGEDKRAETIYKEVDLIMAAKEFSVTDTMFLLDVGQASCVQDYTIVHRNQLDGEQYYSLAPLAEKLEEKGLYLAAAVVYRALLEANLDRALSKYYSHGVRYLRKLDALANQIKDWVSMEPHIDYLQKIKQQHSRKSAFWAKCG